MYLVIKHLGSPILALEGERLSSLADHIRNGYPELIEEFDAGRITAEEVDDISQLTFSQPPITERTLTERFMKAILTDRFAVENRLRALEGKPPITRDEFIAALKTILTQ